MPPQWKRSVHVCRCISPLCFLVTAFLIMPFFDAPNWKNCIVNLPSMKIKLYRCEKSESSWLFSFLIPRWKSCGAVHEKSSCFAVKWKEIANFMYMRKKEVAHVVTVLGCYLSLSCSFICLLTCFTMNTRWVMSLLDCLHSGYGSVWWGVCVGYLGVEMYLLSTCQWIPFHWIEIRFALLSFLATGPWWW